MLWGLYYAVLLILEKLFLLRWLDKAPKWVGHVYTIFAFIMGWVLFAITDFAQLGQYVSAMFTATFVDGTALYLLRSNVVLLIAATIGCTTGPLRLWNRVEDKLIRHRRRHAAHRGRGAVAAAIHRVSGG